MTKRIITPAIAGLIAASLLLPAGIASAWHTDVTCSDQATSTWTIINSEAGNPLTFTTDEGPSGSIAAGGSTTVMYAGTSLTVHATWDTGEAHTDTGAGNCIPESTTTTEATTSTSTSTSSTQPTTSSSTTTTPHESTTTAPDSSTTSSTSTTPPSQSSTTTTTQETTTSTTTTPPPSVPPTSQPLSSSSTTTVVVPSTAATTPASTVPGPPSTQPLTSVEQPAPVTIAPTELPVTR